MGSRMESVLSAAETAWMSEWRDEMNTKYKDGYAHFGIQWATPKERKQAAESWFLSEMKSHAPQV